jgi:hypothetical protein
MYTNEPFFTHFVQMYRVTRLRVFYTRLNCMAMFMNGVRLPSAVFLPPVCANVDHFNKAIEIIVF